MQENYLEIPKLNEAKTRKVDSNKSKSKNDKLKKKDTNKGKGNPKIDNKDKS